LLFALPVPARAGDGASSAAGRGSTGCPRVQRTQPASPAETFRLIRREATSEIAGSASVIVVDTSGQRTRIEIKPVPFRIGRQPDSHLILRDSRASRNHAQ